MILTLALLQLLLAAPAATPPLTSPIQVEAVVRETPDGPVRAWIARVDLGDPRVSFVVTGPLEEREGVPVRAEARLQPTDTWAEKAGVDLAVNAGFFERAESGGVPAPGQGPGSVPGPGLVPGQGPGPRPGPGPGWTDGIPVNVVGLSRSEGRTVSPPRVGGGDAARPDPALLIDETKGDRCPCVVRPAYAGEGDLEGIEDAVAGYGSRDGNPGTLLVENGENRGATAQVEPARRHPRTAAGVSRDGKTLLLLVVDGRQPGWSIGVTLPELAQMMLEAGAWNAVNLDGGGSSAMWHREPGAAAGRILNRPSDGRVRPAANHLGVRVTRPSDR